MEALVEKNQQERSTLFKKTVFINGYSTANDFKQEEPEIPFELVAGSKASSHPSL